MLIIARSGSLFPAKIANQPAKNCRANHPFPASPRRFRPGFSAYIEAAHFPAILSPCIQEDMTWQTIPQEKPAGMAAGSSAQLLLDSSCYSWCSPAMRPHRATPPQRANLRSSCRRRRLSANNHNPINPTSGGCLATPAFVRSMTKRTKPC